MTFQVAIERAKADLDVAQAAVNSRRAAVQRMQPTLETAWFEHAAPRRRLERPAERFVDAAAEARRKRAFGSTVGGADLTGEAIHKDATERWIYIGRL